MANRAHQKTADADHVRPILVRGMFTDFDHFGEMARGWDLRTTLLKPGGFRARLLQFVLPSSQFHFSRAQYSSVVRQLGAPPADLLTFFIPAHADFRMGWRRQEVTGQDLGVFPVGGELLAHCQSDFDVMLASFPLETVVKTAACLGYPELGQTLSQTEVFRCKPHMLESLRAAFAELQFLVIRKDGEGVDRSRLRVLETAILCITNSEGSSAEGSAPMKLRAVFEAEDYILQNAREAPLLKDVCSVARVSERTLRTAFKQHFGVPPKSYINAVRLNGARSELSKADPETTRVADVANAWGFWHMGQFAADYRKMFLELPSETLGRGEEEHTGPGGDGADFAAF